MIPPRHGATSVQHVPLQGDRLREPPLRAQQFGLRLPDVDREALQGSVVRLKREQPDRPVIVTGWAAPASAGSRSMWVLTVRASGSSSTAFPCLYYIFQSED